MKNHRIERQVRATGEMQSLAARQNPDPTLVAQSRIFALGARIAVGILYFACFAAAVAQSPQDSRPRSRSTVVQLAPRAVTAIAEARRYFRGKPQANMAAASIGLLYLVSGTQPATRSGSHGEKVFTRCLQDTSGCAEQRQS